MRKFILRVVSRDDKNCAEPKKNTRGLLFFVSLSEFTLEKENDLMRERVEVPSFSLGARSAMMIKNNFLPRGSLTISGTKQPALCYDYLNF